MDKHNEFRRLVLKSICATAIAISLPVAAQDSDTAPPVAWEIPTMEVMIAEIYSAGGDNGMWEERAVSMVEAVWPALAFIARENTNVVSLDLYSQMMDLKNLEKFGMDHEDTHEGKKVNHFMSHLPYYVRGEKLCESTYCQFGFLAMQTSSIVRNRSVKVA